MKKFLIRIIVPLVIAAIAAVYFFIKDNDTLVLIYFGIIILILLFRSWRRRHPHKRSGFSPKIVERVRSFSELTSKQIHMGK